MTQDLLQQAELELTRFVQVTDGRVSPEARKLLRGIVYTNPYFREAGIIDERGFLVHSTAADIETLGETVRRRVRENSGVELEWEIKRIGAAIPPG